MVRITYALGFCDARGVAEPGLAGADRPTVHGSCPWRACRMVISGESQSLTDTPRRRSLATGQVRRLRPRSLQAGRQGSNLLSFSRPLSQQLPYVDGLAAELAAPAGYALIRTSPPCSAKSAKSLMFSVASGRP